MKYIHRFIVAVCTVLVLSFSSFSQADGHNSYSRTDAKQLISIAEKRLAKAKRVGYEWTTTAPLLQKAKEAFKKKENTKAYQLAHKADQQAAASIIQWIDSRSTWQLNLPK